MFEVGYKKRATMKTTFRRWCIFAAVLLTGIAGFMPVGAAGPLPICEDCDAVVQVAFVINGTEDIGDYDFDMQLAV